MILVWMCVGWTAHLASLSLASPSCSDVDSCRPPVSGGAVVGYWPFDNADATLDLNISRSVTGVRLPYSAASVCSVQADNTRTLACSLFSTSLEPIFTTGAAVTSTAIPLDGDVAATFAEIQGDIFNSDRLSMSIWMATTNTSDASIQAINATLFAGQCTLLTSSAGEVTVVPHRSSCLQWWIVEGHLTLVLPTLDAASSQTWIIISSTAPLVWADDEWHHLSVVCSALLTTDDGACRFFHNGQMLSTSQQSTPWALTFESTLDNIGSVFPLTVVTINSSSSLSTDCQGVLALLDLSTALQAVANGSYSATQHGDGVDVTLSWNDGTTLNVSSSCSVLQQYVVAAAWSDPSDSATTMVWLDELWVVNFALTQLQRQSLIQYGTPVSPRTSNYYSFDHGILSRKGGGHSTFVHVNDTAEIAASPIPAIVRQGLALPLSVHVQTNTTNMFHHPRWDLPYSRSVASYIGFQVELAMDEVTPLWSFVTSDSLLSHHLSFWPDYSAEAGSTPSLFVSYGALNQTLPIIGSALMITNQSTDDTQWYHVAVTFDAKTQTLSVYINGNISWSTDTTGVVLAGEGRQNVTVALGNNPHSPHYQSGGSVGGARRLLQTAGQGSVFVDEFHWGNTVLSVEEVEYMSSPTNTVCTSTPQAGGCPVLHLSLDYASTESFYGDTVTVDSTSILSPYYGVFGGMVSLRKAQTFGFGNPYVGIGVTPKSVYQYGVFGSFQHDASLAFWVLTNTTTRASASWTMYRELGPNGAVVQLTWSFDRIYLSTATSSYNTAANTSYVTYNDTRVFSENQWHHLLLVYRWNLNTLSLYVDNIVIVIMTIANPTRWPSTTVFPQQWGGWYMQVDELYAFNVAITPDMEQALAEINTIFITPATCPVGRYYVEAYNTVQQQETLYCYTCPHGSLFNTSSEVCQPCSAGHYFNLTASNCTACLAGSFSNVTGALNASTCSACGPGYFSQTPGSPSCSACQPGFYSNFTSATICNVSCLAGSESQAGAAQCTNCQAGYTSYGGPAGCSPCPATYVQSGNTCTFCGDLSWSYSGQEQDTTCYDCTADPCDTSSPYTRCRCD